MSAVETEAKTRFHLSLNVSDLARSIEFLQTLLGVAPAKVRADYAKFELDDPPLVLSLEPGANVRGGALNHVGFRLPNSEALVAAQRRLEAAGMPTRREEGVECCYARQTKFWANDPDGTLWEIYVLEQDVEHRGAGQALAEMAPASLEATAAAPRRVVAHRLGQSFDDVLQDANNQSLAAGSVDEFLLQGTFNARLGAAERRRILEQVFRVLQPGGQLMVHALTSDRPLARPPQLPGPASVVQETPVCAELLAELEAAGLVDIQLAKFGESPCFRFDGAELRETKALAWKPALIAACRGDVLYKGPFRELIDDAGKVFRRGERVSVDADAWDRLQASPAAGQFLFLAAADAAVPLPRGEVR